MLGLFTKRNPTPTAKDLSSQTASALEEVKGKWIYFNEVAQLQPSVPLSRKIELFLQPIQQYFQAKYPLLLAGPSEVFWLTVFTAILESGTHPKEEINAALAELRSQGVVG